MMPPYRNPQLPPRCLPGIAQSTCVQSPSDTAAPRMGAIISSQTPLRFGIRTRLCPPMHRRQPDQNPYNAFARALMTYPAIEQNPLKTDRRPAV
jgi:hypothetical protein